MGVCVCVTVCVSVLLSLCFSQTIPDIPGSGVQSVQCVLPQHKCFRVRMCLVKPETFSAQPLNTNSDTNIHPEISIYLKRHGKARNSMQKSFQCSCAVTSDP